MKKIAKLILIAVITTPLCLDAGQAFAKGKGGGGGHDKGGTPGGFSQGEKKGWKGEKTPPGWSHGKKKGWGDAGMPPGQAKKLEKAKT